MKKIILLSLIILISFSGCKKLLDLKPQTDYADSNFWTEEVHATAALNAAYNRLQFTFAPEFIYWGEGRTDNVTISAQTNNSAINVTGNTMDPGMPEANWQSFYQVIKQTNLILKNIEKLKQNGLFSTTATLQNYKNIKGQAFGLRALSYLYMVRLWGGVPVITEPFTDSNNDLAVSRADVQTVYNLIQKDIDSASTLLSTTLTYATPQKTRANLTKGAVDAIATDFYMLIRDYDKALLSSEKVINNVNYKLATLYDPAVDYLSNRALIDNSEYAKMFTAGFSNESIFEIDYNQPEGTGSNMWGAYGRIAQSFFKPSSKLLLKYTTNDLRPLQNFFVTDNGIYKFFTKTNFDQTLRDENIILYRRADIMLLRAEALNQKNRVPEAIALVNQIRQRAGISQYVAADYITLDKNAIEDLILDERQRELCFEGKRWYDLLRTSKAIITMGPINGLSSEENLLWPISLDVIRINSKIAQNSFYK